MVVVMEEMGRLPFPGPFFSSSVFATLAARRLEDADLLAQLASGAIRGHGRARGARPRRSRSTACVPAPARKGADWVLTGQKPLVLDGHTADWVIVVARTEDGLGSFLLEAPARRGGPDDGPDPQGGPSRARGAPGGAGRPARRPDRVVASSRRRRVGHARGGARRRRATPRSDLAIEYAKVRVQFDRPIATFQAIRHKAVDMLHQLELARVGDALRGVGVGRRRPEP